jgi:hypothetical protein
VIVNARKIVFGILRGEGNLGDLDIDKLVNNIKMDLENNVCGWT